MKTDSGCFVVLVHDAGRWVDPFETSDDLSLSAPPGSPVEPADAEKTWSQATEVRRS